MRGFKRDGVLGHVLFGAGKRVRASKRCMNGYMEKWCYGELNMVKWGLMGEGLEQNTLAVNVI